MKKSSIVIAVSLVLVLAVALSVLAQAPNTPQHRPGKNPGRNIGPGAGPSPGAMVSIQRLLMPPSRAEMERLAVQLGLNDQQKAQVQQLQRNFVTAARPFYEARAQGVKALVDVMQSPSPSKGQFESALEKIERADRGIANAEFDFWVGFKRILTGQQQQSLSNYIQERGKVAAPPMAPGGPQPPRAPRGPATPGQ